jgi:hypothetical protein
MSSHNILIVYRQGESWMVDHSCSQDASKIRRLFGATVLPTAYLISMPLAEVLAQLQLLNPNHRIIAGQEPCQSAR